MKKTTTRLATTTAVLLMSAFAIILAQHDARKSAHEKDHDMGQHTNPSEPPMPLALDNWPSSTAVVRGNNAGLDDELIERPDGDLGEQSLSENYDNPLRDLPVESLASEDLVTAAAELFSSEVVTASGENPVPPASFPALPNGSGSSPTALQPLPGNLPAGLPSLDALPTGALTQLPSTNSAGSQSNSALQNGFAPQSMPQTFAPQPMAQVANQPAAQTSARLPGQFPGGAPAGGAPAGGAPTGGAPTTGGQGFQQLPASAQNLPGTASLGVPNPTAASAPSGNRSAAGFSGNSTNMSDTQRGAMVPTQLVDAARNNLPATIPATLPSQTSNGFANSSPPAANFDNNRPGFAPLNSSLPPSGLGSSGLGSSGPSLNSTTASSNLNSNSTSGFNSNPTQAEYPNRGNMRSDGNELESYAGPSRNASANMGASASTSTSALIGTAQYGNEMGNSGARANLASNQPGSRFLDGSQNPVMQIHKRAPEEITVGKKATFVITVRNAGNATAHDVTVVDRIPRGAKFADASPTVAPSGDGLLTWKLGEMNAGDEKIINLQIVPEAEGEVGSVASVHFAAQASVRTMATAPQLEVTADSTGPVIIGQVQQVTVTIRNTGSGVSRGVRLEADIPTQLKHESGEAQLEAFIGDLRPNESKRLVLNVAAVQPGQSTCPLRAVNEDGVQAQAQFSVDVRAPQLVATISGPARRYLERQATYQIVVNNSGTAVARNLYFDVHLPVGLKFISADIAQATYHPESHSVTLGLAELNPGANGTFSVTVLPVELGPQNIRFNATGDLGVAAEAKGQMVVEGLSELTFSIAQDNGTVEVGATTTYSVQISNVGNQSDKNVQLQVQIPEGAKLLKVDAPVDFREEPGRLVFAPIGEMRTRDVKTLRFQVQHNRAGNQVIRAQLTSVNWPVAVLKEEGTLVYNDQ